jgi:hypothetical protein
MTQARAVAYRVVMKSKEQDTPMLHVDSRFSFQGKTAMEWREAR